MKMKLTIRSVSNIKPEDKPYEIYDTEIAGFLLRVQPTGRTTYYLAYRNKLGTKRRAKIGGSITAIQARDAAKLLKGDIAKGVDVCERDKQKKINNQLSKQSTLKAFFNEAYSPWLLKYRRNGKSDIRSISTHFKRFMSSQLKDISKWNIQKWQMDKKKLGLSNHTINRYLAELQALLNKAVEWGRLEFNPIAGLKKPKGDDNKITRYLSDSERKRLYWAMDDREQEIIRERRSANQWRTERGYELLDDFRDRAFADHLKPFVVLALKTGMRRGEIFKLTWKNTNLTTAQITVASSTAKSKKTRYIPINDEALSTLKQWKDQQSNESDFVFPGKSGQPLDNIKKSWTGLMTRAGIRDFRFHDLRHDFASQLVMKEVSLYVVKELLGHSTIQVTERYAHLAPKQLENAVNLLNEK